MRKLRYFTTIICSLCLLALPTVGLAKAVLMSDEELAQITAQAGFSDILGLVQINRDNATGAYYFGGNGGYISFTNLTYQGQIGIDPSAITQIVSENGAVGYECKLDGRIIDIQNLSTTVRLGTEIGAGSSLGTFGIGHMAVDIHGTMRVTTF
jgi:hypothetical protein